MSSAPGRHGVCKSGRLFTNVSPSRNSILAALATQDALDSRRRLGKPIRVRALQCGENMAC